jgi:anthranilate/para-aminobenzoate synthase component II
MILIVDMNCKKDSLGYFEFVLPIVSIAKELEDSKVKHYSELTDDDIYGSSRIVLSGTPLKDNDTFGHPEKFKWLKSVNKPILGICAGAQTIGVAFDLVLTRRLEIGMTQIVTLTENHLFSGTFKAYSLHNYCVESSDEFEILAESECCIQALKHKQKPIYGILFHPEVRNPEILKHFLQMKQTIDSA